MKYIRKIIFSLIFCFLFLPSVNAEEKVKLYLFYNYDCPHCADEKVYLNQLDEEYDNLEIIKYEVKKDETNKELLSDFLKKQEWDINAVPITIIGTNYFVGYNDDIGTKIRCAINYYSDTPHRDLVGEYLGTSYVREDLICLYGFLNREEQRMFELLLSVSGIGAKSAIATLSNITPSSFALAVITNNVATLTKIPGVGNKTAQRLILELKDKIKTEEAVAKAPETKLVIETNENVEEATAALQILGYTKKEIEKALEHISLENASVEEIIRKCLTLLGK